jgi:hypothetical protein
MKPETKELEKQHREWLNDPVVLRLNYELAQLFAKQTPKMVIDLATGFTEIVYSDEFVKAQKELYKAKDLHMKQHYPLLYASKL